MDRDAKTYLAGLGTGGVLAVTHPLLALGWFGFSLAVILVASYHVVPRSDRPTRPEPCRWATGHADMTGYIPPPCGACSACTVPPAGRSTDGEG